MQFGSGAMMEDVVSASMGQRRFAVSWPDRSCNGDEDEITLTGR